MSSSGEGGVAVPLNWTRFRFERYRFGDWYRLKGRVFDGGSGGTKRNFCCLGGWTIDKLQIQCLRTYAMHENSVHAIENIDATNELIRIADLFSSKNSDGEVQLQNEYGGKSGVEGGASVGSSTGCPAFFKDDFTAKTSLRSEFTVRVIDAKSRLALPDNNTKLVEEGLRR